MEVACEVGIEPLTVAPRTPALIVARPMVCPVPRVVKVPVRPLVIVALVVATVLSTPEFPYITPVRVASFGALVKVVSVPEKVLESARSVEEAAVTVTEPPRETPLPLTVMDELVSPVLLSVPVMLGVPKVKAPPVLVMVCTTLRPLNDVAEEVAKVMAPVCAVPPLTLLVRVSLSVAQPVQSPLATPACSHSSN